MKSLKIQNVSKIFTKGKEEVKAVDNFNIEVEEGEMIAFLGPSGCGKTTTLRMVAGFEIPTHGIISINNEDITKVPVNKRGIGFVFQNYALFPHMSVFNNVAYGLKSKNITKEEIKERVLSALALVNLKNSEARYPNQLSGGEQQRIALARVIVMKPSLLLMDEPLSNLDVKLRIQMRTEIRRIQKTLGITCLYVTHDQSEALSVADRIVVMNKGKIEQIGTPLQIYSRPTSPFVADFIGQANIIKLKVISEDEKTINASFLDKISIRVNKVFDKSSSVKKDDLIDLIIRPENIRLSHPLDGFIKAKVKTSIFVGSSIEYEVTLENNEFIKVNSSFNIKEKIFKEGDEVSLIIDEDAALYLNNEKYLNC